jgi:hypothetical protein
VSEVATSINFNQNKRNLDAAVEAAIHLTGIDA